MRINSIFIFIMLLNVFASSVHAQQDIEVSTDDGLVGYWSFDEGVGGVVFDKSGNGNDGKINGAKWVKCGNGFALSFDGQNDYVEVADSTSLNFGDSMDFTIELWLKTNRKYTWQMLIDKRHQRRPYEGYSFLINYNQLQFVTIDKTGVQASCQRDFSEYLDNFWHYIVGTADRDSKMSLYVDGVLFAAVDMSKVGNINTDLSFLIANAHDAKGKAQSNTVGPEFIDDICIYRRVLGTEEIAEKYLHYYNLDAEEKGLELFDMSKLGRLGLLEPFFYPDTDKAVLSVDFQFALPITEGATAVAELSRPGSKQAYQSHRLNPNAVHNEDEAEFSLEGLKPGTYELRAKLIDEKGMEKVEGVQFKYPFESLASPPSPESYIVGPLPAKILPPEYKVDVSTGGGLNVTVKDRTYMIESSYSYPHGGENKLVTADTAEKGDGVWNVKSERLNETSYRVSAKGKYYSISRSVTLEKTRIYVKDTIKNTSDDIIGIILSNYINLSNAKDAKVVIMDNPTIFAGVRQSGIGIIAMDDLYQLQQRVIFSHDMAEIRDEHFGLDKGASYTIEWAVYPTATDNYYDFINQIRKDEGINRRVDGAFCFVGKKNSPSKEFLDLRNVKYASLPCLGRPVGGEPRCVAIEGFEFMEYPQECAFLKQTMGRTKQMFPDVKVMFHVALGLYCTNRPNELFPDSKAVYANGSQIHWGPNTVDYYGPRLTKELFEKGWRWWTFYPTLENSFGKAMIKAMEYMVDEIGATGMWADGFISCFVRDREGDYYSYDKWDGHSVTIDPKTKLVIQKKTCVPYVALPVLKKVVRIISSRGGALVSSGHPGPRSLWKEDMITSCEPGRPINISKLHLGRTVTPLMSPRMIKNERDIYREVLGKLDYGALAFLYGEGNLITHKTILEHMYPITFDNIQPGTVYGKERIVTKKPGVYGWHNDHNLHIVFLYDARGILTRNNFTTTVNSTSVRTKLTLKKNQSAVIVKLPIILDTSGPVNVNVRQYDTDIVRLALNGNGVGQIRITNGYFTIDSSKRYELVVNGKHSKIERCDEQLTFDIEFDGSTELVIRSLP